MSYIKPLRLRDPHTGTLVDGKAHFHKLEVDKRRGIGIELGIHQHFFL